MNIIIAIQTKWRPGANQVMHQTNQVVSNTQKRPSENTVRLYHDSTSCYFSPLHSTITYFSS